MCSMDKVNAFSVDGADMEDIERLNESIRVIQAQLFSQRLVMQSLEQALREDEDSKLHGPGNSNSAHFEDGNNLDKSGLAVSSKQQLDTSTINIGIKRALLKYMGQRTKAIKSIVVDAAGDSPVAEKKQVYINIRCGSGSDYQSRFKVPPNTTVADVCASAKLIFGIPMGAVFFLQDEGGNFWSPRANIYDEFKLLGHEASFFLVHKSAPPRNLENEAPSERYIQHIAKLEDYQNHQMEDIHSQGQSRRVKNESRGMAETRRLLSQIPRTLFIVVLMLFWAFSRESPAQTSSFHKTITDKLTRTRFGDKYAYKLSDATTKDLIFDYARGPLLQTVFASTEISGGQKVSGVIENTIYVIGKVRVRQLRVARGTCDISSSTGIKDRIVSACYGRYEKDSITNPLSSTSKPSYFTLDPQRRLRDGFWGNNETFCNRSSSPVSGAFNNFFDEKALTRDAGLAKTSSEVLGGEIQGALTTYDAMGFFDEIALDSEDDFRAYIDRLESCHWVDLATRVVFFEVNFFNPNLEMYMVGHVIFEIDPTGLVVPDVQFQGLKLNVTFGLEWYLEQLIFLIFLRQIHLWKADIVRTTKQNGSSLEWWTNPWTILDVASVVIFMIVYVRRWIYLGLPPLVMNSRALLVNEDRTNDERDPIIRNSYVYLGDYAEEYNFNSILDVVATFLSIVRLLRFATLSRSARILLNTIKYGLTKTLTYLAMFSAIVYGFVILYYNLYGTRLKAFSTVMGTTRSILTSLVTSSVGEAYFAPIFQAPWDSEEYHLVLWLVFTLSMHFILVHIFLAIIIHSHEQVQLAELRAAERGQQVKLTFKIALEEFVYGIFGYRKKKKRILMNKDSDSEDEDAPEH